MPIKDCLQNLKRRDQLGKDIISLLNKDERVTNVEFYGSLAKGTADPYSDIDLHVQLQNVSDRAFAEILPDLIRPVDTCLIEGWGLGALPDDYVRTFYFESYPIFWHVDIHCKSAHHIDGSDIQNTYHWSQIFKIWIDVVSNWARGKDTTDYIERFMGKWTDLSKATGSPPQKLSQYLDLCAERARKRGAPCDTFYNRCDELRREYLEA